MKQKGGFCEFAKLGNTPLFECSISVRLCEGKDIVVYPSEIEMFQGTYCHVWLVPHFVMATRTRFWGPPLPIYQHSCDFDVLVYSIKTANPNFIVMRCRQLFTCNSNDETLLPLFTSLIFPGSTSCKQP